MAVKDMSERWPLHPLPFEHDLLTRWVRRIAKEYGVSYHLFCLRILNLTREEADHLNENPSEEALGILAKGTGQPLQRLREMTWAGAMGRLDKIVAENPEAVELMIARMRDALKKPTADID
jgi:hypothetical protein